MPYMTDFNEPMDWTDYLEAGAPYGKAGYVRWLRERYEERIAELETKLTEASKPVSEHSLYRECFGSLDTHTKHE